MRTLVDCDIHIAPQLHEDLKPYLSTHWQDYVNESAFVGPDARDYPANAPLTTRPEVRVARQNGGVDPLEAIQGHVLDLSLIHI